MLFSFLKVCEKRGDGLYVYKDAIRLKKLFFRVLEAAGIEVTRMNEIAIILEYDCAEKLIYLAKHATELAKDKEGKIHHEHKMVYFTRVVFKNKKDWLIDNLDYGMQAQEILKKLCAILEQRGFYRSVYIDGRRLTLNYVKDFLPVRNKTNKS